MQYIQQHFSKNEDDLVSLLSLFPHVRYKNWKMQRQVTTRITCTVSFTLHWTIGRSVNYVHDRHNEQWNHLTHTCVWLDPILHLSMFLFYLIAENERVAFSNCSLEIRFYVCQLWILAHSVSNAQARGAFYCSATHNLQIWCWTAIIENLNLRSPSWQILCDAPVSDTNYVRSAHVLIVQMTIVCAC